MFNQGDKVIITEGIYSGAEVEIVEAVGETEMARGYSVRGLTTPNAVMSTFWDDQLELVR
jgi:hypothetical protein